MFSYKKKLCYNYWHVHQILGQELRSLLIFINLLGELIGVWQNVVYIKKNPSKGIKWENVFDLYTYVFAHLKK